jgi:xylose isomerase
VRERTIRYVKRGIDLASQLDAGVIYACSMRHDASNDRISTLQRFKHSVSVCADYAHEVGLKFALEPFPGGELPTVAETILFLNEMKSKNVGVLIDTGHASISGESLRHVVRISKDNIAHVHLNNNDGVNDLHWPPQSGKLAVADFIGFLAELRAHK